MKKRISLVLKLGKPAVLSTESLHAYMEQVDSYELAFDPTDAYEVALVRDAIDATFETARYGRLKVMLIESKVLSLRELEAKRAQASAEKKEVVAKRLAAKSSAPANEPEEAVDRLVEEVDAILLEPVNELENARAFQAVLTEYDIIDKLQIRAIARRDNAIAQLERYRNGMGSRTRQMIDEFVAASAAGEVTTEKFLDINDSAEEWAQWLAERDAREAQYFKKPQPISEVPTTTNAQQAAAQPQKPAALPNASDVQPGVDKEPAPAEASAAVNAPKSQTAKPESEPLPVCDAPTATDVQQAAANSQKLTAVPDAPDVQPGGVDKEPAPVDASPAAEAQKLQPEKPESEPQQTCDPSSGHQGAADPQKLAAVPDAPHAQPGGVEKEPASVEVSAAADAPKLQPAMSENVPQQAREAPSATKGQPQ